MEKLSFEDVDLSIEQLKELINSITNNNEINEKDLESLFNKSEKITYINDNNEE